MIRTATQLKAKVRNMSGGDSTKAQTLIRNFIMERFLERIALSPYRDSLILKGGMLVASIVGLETRATMDIDTTARLISLSRENAIKMVGEIITVAVDDGVTFTVTRVTEIMEEHDYPGIRFMLEATQDRMQQAIRLDISTGDIITPGAVKYAYPLMFEKRTIPLWTYNLETLLAEKLETVMTRGTTNTRMRDFYDIHILTQREPVDAPLLKAAFLATSEKRNSLHQVADLESILQTVEQDETMQKLWERYRDESFFVGGLTWEVVMEDVKNLFRKAK